MSDASTTSTTSTPPQTQTPPAANTPEARNPDGSLKDGLTSPPSEKTDKSTTSEPKTDTKADTKTETKDGDKKAPAGAPEKYEFKVPDGQRLDEKLVETVSPILKELNLSQDQAQKLFDFYNANANKGQQELVNAYEETRKGWRKEAVSGDLGDGTNLKPDVSQNIGAFFQAMDAKAADALKNALDLTGAGDHPALVSAMSAVGKLLREGTSVKGTNPSPLGQKQPGQGPVSLASAMFPNLKSSGT